MKPKNLIIIGGGQSIKEGIEKGLWDKLVGKFTFGLNYSFNFFEPATVQVYVDALFYQKEMDSMEHLPLVIGKHFKELKKKIKPNTIMVPSYPRHNRNLTKGVYKSSLCGLYALTLGIYLLGEGEIFLLGYDFGALNKEKDSRNRFKTHFYQGEIEHRGIGKYTYYNSIKRQKEDFGVFENETKVKIYNVSLNSNIDNFTKISYDEFFKKLESNKYDQETLRKEIKSKLKEKGYV